jgi:hypothetical protein
MKRVKAMDSGTLEPYAGNWDYMEDYTCIDSIGA